MEEYLFKFNEIRQKLYDHFIGCTLCIKFGNLSCPLCPIFRPNFFNKFRGDATQNPR